MEKFLLAVLLVITLCLTFAFWYNAQELTLVRGTADQVFSLFIFGAITGLMALASGIGLVVNQSR